MTGQAEPEQVEDVTDGLLPALGVQPALGRLFSRKDDLPGAPKTAMISYGYWQRKTRIPGLRLSSRNFSGSTPMIWGSAAGAIGKQVRESPAGPWREIVGVLGNERDEGVDKPASTTVYWPILVKKFWGQDYAFRRSVRYVIRSERTGSEGFLNEIRQAVWSVNGELPIAGARTLGELYAKSMARTSFALVMLAIAGAMALLLGLIGIYGVIAYAVTQRTREIGIRMALGAQQSTLTRMFIAHGLRLAAVGLAFGLVAAFALTRTMKALLFGVGAADPMTYSAVAVVLGAAAALAAWVPSRRTMRVDPVESLRAE